MNIHARAIKIRRERKELEDNQQQKMEEYIDKQREIIIDSLFEDIFKLIKDTRIRYRFEMDNPSDTSLGINLIFFYQGGGKIIPETVIVNIRESGMWEACDIKSGKSIQDGNMDELILLLDGTFYSGISDYADDEIDESPGH